RSAQNPTPPVKSPQQETRQSQEREDSSDEPNSSSSSGTSSAPISSGTAATLPRLNTQQVQSFAAILAATANTPIQSSGAPNASSGTAPQTKRPADNAVRFMPSKVRGTATFHSEDFFSLQRPAPPTPHNTAAYLHLKDTGISGLQALQAAVN